jgi:sulfate transport system permease protein
MTPDSLTLSSSQRPGLAANVEPPWVRWTLILIALLFLTLFLLVPLAAVFVEAFKKGWEVYVASVLEPDALSALRLTLLAAAVSVPLNLGGGCLVHCQV